MLMGMPGMQASAFLSFPNLHCLAAEPTSLLLCSALFHDPAATVGLTTDPQQHSKLTADQSLCSREPDSQGFVTTMKSYRSGGSWV